MRGVELTVEKIEQLQRGQSYGALQRQNTEISKQIFPEKEYRGLSPNFHIHVSVSHLYKQIAHRHMDVEIGAEAALFPEKEYICGIFVAVCV